MVNDVSPDSTTNRQGRQRRRFIAGAVAAVEVVAAVVAGGTWQHSKAGTSGALGVHECSTMVENDLPGDYLLANYLPSVAPKTEVDWSICVMTHTYLRGAYLWGASLSGSNLDHADLTGAVLISANLSGAILTGGDLSGGDPSGADLTHAKLPGAALTGAALTNAILTSSGRTSVLWSNTTCPSGNNSYDFARCVGQGGGF